MKISRRRVLSIALLALLPTGCMRLASTAGTSARQKTVTLLERHVAVLNSLRDEVNLVYGYKHRGILGTKLVPRVNLGPCGRFAKIFREEWNAKFRHRINIVFVMSKDGTECYHVLVKLPDVSYFDGGNGVITGPTLLAQYPQGTFIDEMVEFDLELLERWSYGLVRDYKECPNYSDETTIRLIRKHLAMITDDDL